MGYHIKEDRCKGTFQPVHTNEAGATNTGAEWPSFDAAMGAVQYHAENGVFPSETVETQIPLCEHCGKPLPPAA